MTTKWITTRPKSFDDVSNILSKSDEEPVVRLFTTSFARRPPLPCGRVEYFLPSRSMLSHDFSFLIRVLHDDNWQFRPTFERLGQLLIERYDACIPEEHTVRAKPTTNYSFEEGKAYYERNKVLLTRKYNGEYIAIWNNKVLDHDTSFSALAQRVYKKLGYASIYMPFVTSKRRVLRFESPRRRRATVDAP